MTNSAILYVFNLSVERSETERLTQGIRAVFLQTVIRGQVLRDVDGLTVGPQVLEVVVGAGVGDEDVDDDAGIVQQHPVLGVKTLRGVGLDAALGKLILHLVYMYNPHTIQVLHCCRHIPYWL